MSFLIFFPDIEPPTVQCPEDKLVYVYSGNTSTPVLWEPVATFDNSEKDVELISSHSPNIDQFHLGFSTVNVSAIDASGNKAACSFNVTVKGA